MEQEERILNYNGFFSLEICNSNAMIENGCEVNLALYDKFLRRGNFLYCHGSDDNHNKRALDDPFSDSFGAWTMILAEKLTYSGIIKALEHGDFYASTGPQITELIFDGKHVRLECSPAKRIMMHLSPKHAEFVYDKHGGMVTSAEFEIPTDAAFVYFSVHESTGRVAYTRAFRREEFK